MIYRRVIHTFRANASESAILAVLDSHGALSFALQKSHKDTAFLGHTQLPMPL